MADSKVTALTALTAPLATDVMYVVDDPGGTPISKKIEVGELSSVFYSSQYASLQATVDAAEAAGGKAYIEAGTHALSSSLTVDSSNVTIELDPAAILQASTGLGNGVIYVNSTTPLSNVTICGSGKIDGNSQTTTKGVYVNGPATNVKIRDIEVTGTTSTPGAIYIYGNAGTAVDCSISGVYCHDCAEGLLLHQCDQSSITECKVEDITSQDNLEVSGCNSCVISNNSTKNCGPNNAHIDVYQSDATVVVGNTIYQDAADTNTYGISVAGAGTRSTNTIVNSNSIYSDVTSTQGASGADANTILRGIQVSAADSTLICGNHIYGCCQGTLGRSIYTTGKDTTIVGNHLERSAGSHIQVINATGTALIDANALVDNNWNTSSSDTGAILFGGTSPDRWTVNNNSFTNNNGTLDAIYYINAFFVPNGLMVGNTSDGNLAGTGNPVNAQGTDVVIGANAFLQPSDGALRPYSKIFGEATITTGTSVFVSGIEFGQKNFVQSQVQLTLVDPGSGTAPGKWWISSAGNQQFGINVDVSVTNAVFAWCIISTG